MERLTRAPGVREQRDLRLYAAEELTDAIRDADDVDPGEPVLVLSSERTLYELNSAGAVLWEALKSPHSIPELEQVISAFFGISRDQAARDVTAFVTELRALRLITTSSS